MCFRVQGSDLAGISCRRHGRKHAKPMRVADVHRVRLSPLNIPNPKTPKSLPEPVVGISMIVVLPILIVCTNVFMMFLVTATLLA